MLKSILTRTAILTTAVVVSVLSLAGSAQAHEADHVVEQGSFKFAAAGIGSVTATFKEYMEIRGPVARLNVRVDRATGGPECVFARVTFHFVSGNSPSSDTRLVCSNYTYQYSQSVISSEPGLLLSYTVKLLGMTSPTATFATLYAQRWFPMGPDSDSAGDQSHLDRDLLSATKSGQTVFTGFTDYRIETTWIDFGDFSLPSFRLASRLVGDLSWSSAMPGMRANATITWTYMDGTTSTATSAAVSSSSGPVHLDMISEPGMNVWSVKVTVSSGLRGTDYGVQAATPTVKFGDYLTS